LGEFKLNRKKERLEGSFIKRKKEVKGLPEGGEATASFAYNKRKKAEKRSSLNTKLRGIPAGGFRQKKEGAIKEKLTWEILR